MLQRGESAADTPRLSALFANLDIFSELPVPRREVEIVESADRPADCDEASGSGGGYLSKMRQNITSQSYGKIIPR